MKLFAPGKIGKLQLKNRIVMSPMATLLTELDGRISQRCIDYYAARARGGTGLIITGSFVVGPWNGSTICPIINDQLRFEGKSFITRINELAEAVHDSGAKLSIQFDVHDTYLGTGRASRSRGGGTVSGSRWFDNAGMRVPKTVIETTEEIERLVHEFEFAAGVVSAAGADCVDLSSHRGGFLDQFLTPLWNKRTDKYGGSLENRLRFAAEVIQAVKRGAGADFPVTYRYGLTHFIAEGRQIEEGLDIARRLETAGADALLIDGGCRQVDYWTHPPSTQPPGCMLNLAAMVKKVITIPVIAVGKLGYPEVAERALQEGKADFIALGRQLIADPDWANKVKEGRFEDIRPCIGDNEGCEGRIMKHYSISCTVNPAAGMEKEFTLTPAERRKTVLVVGGGPSGMEAARVAATRGHKVTLWEKSNTLGGNLLPASVPDFKQDYRRLVNYLINQVKKAGVTIELGKEATPELVQAMNPEVVFIATGGTPLIPQIQGVNEGHVVTAIDVLLGKKQVGKSVVVIGGGIVGTEVALYLAQKGKRVTIVEILGSCARDMCMDNRQHMMQLLGEANVKILTNTTVSKISNEGITIANQNNEADTIKADTVVLAVGLKREDKLSEALTDKVSAEIHTIGDCVKPRKVIEAIWEGFRTARLT